MRIDGLRESIQHAIGQFHYPEVQVAPAQDRAANLDLRMIET